MFIYEVEVGLAEAAVTEDFVIIGEMSEGAMANTSMAIRAGQQGTLPGITRNVCPETMLTTRTCGYPPDTIGGQSKGKAAEGADGPRLFGGIFGGGLIWRAGRVHGCGNSLCVLQGRDLEYLSAGFAEGFSAGGVVGGFLDRVAVRALGFHFLPSVVGGDGEIESRHSMRRSR